MGFKRYVLVTTALAGLWSSGQAVAQTAAAGATASAPAVSEVVVTGIRQSLKKSLQIKKQSDGVVEVVTAEAVGKFPDTNLAESLAHIPGISVDRQFGEGDRVSIDGTDPALNRTFVDGHAIASAAWGGDPQDKSGRNFNYSYISPDIINELKVYKNPEAWLDEGSLGGTVNVTTRKPLDLDANTMFVSGGYDYNDRSAKGNAKASLAYSWKNDAETFGIIGAFTYNKENLARAGIEYFGYGNGSDFLTEDENKNITGVQNPAGMTINGAAPTAANEALLAKARYPAYINYDYFQQTRDREGFSTDIAWKPFPNLQFDLSALYITGNYNNLSQASFSYNTQTSRATAVTVADGLVESASYSSAPATGPGSNSWMGELDQNYRETAINNQTYDLAYKWDVAGFRVTGDVGYTRATGGTRPEYLLNWRTQSGFTYGFNGQKTSLNYLVNPSSGSFWVTEYLEAVNDTTPGGHQVTIPGYNGGKPFKGFQVGGIGNEDLADGEVYGKVDFEHDVDFGPFTKILFGAKYSTHENSDVTHNDATYADVANGSFTVGSLSGAVTPSDLYSGLSATGNALVHAILPAGVIIREINSLPTRYSAMDTSSFFNVREDVSAGYFQSNFAGNKYHGDLGVRIVSTEDDAAFFQTVSTVKSDGTVVNTTQLVHTAHEYTKALPSLNFSYDLTPKVVLRFGVAQVIARPRYSDMAGAFSISTVKPGAMVGSSTNPGFAGSAGGGNPDLKPYQSTNYEASAEWYFKSNSLLAGEIFYRDIQNYIISAEHDQILTDQNTREPGTYSVSSPINAGKASVGGISLTYQWDIGWGFGIQTNYTYAEATTNNGYNMPFLSKNVVNVIPYYERGPWEARVSLNYRTHYFTDIGRLGSSDNTDNYTQVDMKLAYHINKKMSLTFNASNLLDETYYSYSSVKTAPTGIYKNGRVFGLSFSYRQ